MSRDPVQQVNSTMRVASFLPVALALLAAASAPAAAGLRLEPVRGHVSFGYTRLFVQKAPPGNISVSGGLDYPVNDTWRLGGDVGFHLLGSRNVTRGTLLATLDYSVFEALLLAHWQPSWHGPIGRVSFGTGLFHASADLSASGGGAFFTDLPRHENALGFGLDATLMQKKVAPVRVGFELGTRVGLLKQETWTLATARLAFHY